MKNLIPAAGYVRCSTEMQEDSPDQQKLEIQKFVEKTGYFICTTVSRWIKSIRRYDGPGSSNNGVPCFIV